jgi:hypothetical protein
MTHISTIEQLASQLNDLKEPISESQLITKILVTLPSSFRYFLSVWDNVPSDQKTIQLMIKPSQVDLRDLSEDNVNEAEEVLESEEVDTRIRPTENVIIVEGRITSLQRVVSESKTKKKQLRTKKSQTSLPTYNNSVQRQTTTETLQISVTNLSFHQHPKFTKKTSYGSLTLERHDI